MAPFSRRASNASAHERVEHLPQSQTAQLARALSRLGGILVDHQGRDVDGLDRALVAKLAAGEWIARRQDLLITGKTGTGKSWLACALGHKAARDDRSVLYWHVPHLLDALALARGDGRHARPLKCVARVELLILDDWGPNRLTANHRRDMMEIVEDRYGRGSTLITS